MLLRGTGGDLDLRAYDRNGVAISSSAVIGSSTESLTVAVVAGETYFLRVDPRTNAVSRYALSASYAGDTSGDGNDTFDRAAVRPFIMREVGTVGGGDTDDYFRFTAAATGTISIGIGGLDSNVDLKIYGANGTLLNSSTQTGISGESVDVPVVTGTDYVVRVEARDGNSSSYSLSSILVADGSQSDGDDTFSRAATFDPAIGVVSSIGPSDPFDYYRFVAAATGPFLLSITENTPGITAIIYRTTASNRVADIGVTNTSSAAAFSVVAGDTYIVAVQPSGAQRGSYRLAGGAASDGNDTVATAQILTLANPEAGSVNGSGGDPTDYYRFTASSDGLISVTAAASGASFFGGATAAILRAYDSDGGLIAERNANASNGAGTATLQLSMTAGTSYVLGVFSGTTTSPVATYSLSSQTVSASALDGNESFATATPRTTGLLNQSNFVGGADSGDFYAFTPTQNGLVALSVGSLAGNLDLTVYDAAQSVIARSARLGTLSEDATLFVTAGQQYFFRIAPVGIAQSSYTYSIGNVSPVATSETGDIGASAGSARTLYAGMTFSASLGGATDSDWFAVPIAAGESVTVRVRGVQSGVGTLSDPDIVVRNQAGTILQEIVGNPGSDVTVTLAAGTELKYVDVRSNTGATGTYQISVTAVPPQSGASSAADVGGAVVGVDIPDAPLMSNGGVGYALYPAWHLETSLIHPADF